MTRYRSRQGRKYRRKSPLERQIDQKIEKSFDVWSSCGCESYEWSVDENVAADVIAIVRDGMESDPAAIRYTAMDLDMDQETVERVVRRFMEVTL